jgi:hypothetical protein
MSYALSPRLFCSTTMGIRAILIVVEKSVKSKAEVCCS